MVEQIIKILNVKKKQKTINKLYTVVSIRQNRMKRDCIFIVKFINNLRKCIVLYFYEYD